MQDQLRVVAESQAHLIDKFDRFDQRLTKVEQDTAIVKDIVLVLHADVATLKEEVSVLKEDVSVLKEDVSVLKRGQATLEQKVDRVEEKVDQQNDRFREFTTQTDARLKTFEVEIREIKDQVRCM